MSDQPQQGRHPDRARTEFEDLEVDAPRVGIIMGSKSDMPAMEKAGEELADRASSRDPRDVLIAPMERQTRRLPCPVPTRPSLPGAGPI